MAHADWWIEQDISSPRQPAVLTLASRDTHELPQPIVIFRRCMYALIIARHRSAIKRAQELLRDMALDPRAFPGGGSPDVSYRSTASAPSLRARESEVVSMGRSTPDSAGGNVRVVVRVRGFLPRGTRLTEF